MSAKNIALVINAHHPYIRHVDDEAQKYAKENTLLFEKITNIYIPLLNTLSNLEKDNVQFKIAIAFSSTLCTLLTDSAMKEQYVAWLDDLIEFTKKEIVRTKNNPDLLRNAKENLDRIQQTKTYFVDVYEQNLIKHFALFAKKGFVEVLATCGTYMFMPHYIDMSEILNAQVEVGLYAIKHFFGFAPEGFLLPDMAYTPGIENVLRLYGITYTILAPQSFVFSKVFPEKGIFAPARCNNSLSIFACDSEQNDYSVNPVYRNKHMDVAFELESSFIEPFIKKGECRRMSGLSYWNNLITDDDAEIDEKIKSKKEYAYNSEVAKEQIIKDAEAFLTEKSEKLSKAAAILKNTDLSLTYVLDTDNLGKSWFEGISWVEEVIRKSQDSELKFTSFSDLLIDKFSLQKIEPYPAALSGTGYGEDMLSNKNGWVIRYLRKAGERIVDLACRFPNDTGLKARLLNLGARELIIAQSSEWAKMIENDEYSEYAEKVFSGCISAFTAVFDSLGSNTVSTEWLCDLERKHPLYPWMNYRIFTRKK